MTRRRRGDSLQNASYLLQKAKIQLWNQIRLKSLNTNVCEGAEQFLFQLKTSVVLAFLTVIWNMGLPSVFVSTAIRCCTALSFMTGNFVKIRSNVRVICIMEILTICSNEWSHQDDKQESNLHLGCRVRPLSSSVCNSLHVLRPATTQRLG